MSKPQNFGGFTLYRIFYGQEIVYIGRTKQLLQDRIRGHLFKTPMHRSIDINKVSKIEYSTFQTEADMYLYEIYFINLWHPPLNKDDKATDDLTVFLPSVDWNLFKTNLWEDWRRSLHEKDQEAKKARKHKEDLARKQQELRSMSLRGEIPESEYFAFLDSLSQESFF